MNISKIGVDYVAKGKVEENSDYENWCAKTKEWVCTGKCKKYKPTIDRDYSQQKSCLDCHWEGKYRLKKG